MYADLKIVADTGYDIAPCSIGPHPHYGERPPAVPRFSDPGERKFDFKLGCWIAEPLPAPAAVPMVPMQRGMQLHGDGSGCWWEMRDLRGQPYCRIEAASFEAALEVKREVCSELGGKSGDARLHQLTD